VHRKGPGAQVPGEYASQLDSTERWELTEINPGDIILFNIRTMHGATPNLSDRFRLRYASVGGRRTGPHAALCPAVWTRASLSTVSAWTRLDCVASRIDL
jgi:hypothetical protein